MVFKSLSQLHILPILLAFVLPLSLAIWLFHYLITFGTGAENGLSPIRCLLSILIPTACFYRARRDRKLDARALVVAFTMGLLETLTNYCIIATTVAFFYAGTKATKFKRSMKKTLDQEGSAPRNWVQVISNGGVGLELAILLLIERGPGNEKPIDFRLDYFPSWLSIAFLASMACACGDTLASELAPVLTKSQPRLILWPLLRVPKGTNGGVTIMGFFCSALGGFICGLVYYLTSLIFTHNNLANQIPPQWPLILIGAFAGLFGSLIDSILGASVQYSGIEKTTGQIVGKWRPGVKWISGFEILDNHSVNLLSTLITAILTPYLSQYYFWPNNKQIII